MGDSSHIWLSPSPFVHLLLGPAPLVTVVPQCQELASFPGSVCLQGCYTPVRSGTLHMQALSAHDQQGQDGDIRRDWKHLLDESGGLGLSTNPSPSRIFCLMLTSQVLCGLRNPECYKGQCGSLHLRGVQGRSGLDQAPWRRLCWSPSAQSQS